MVITGLNAGTKQSLEKPITAVLVRPTATIISPGVFAAKKSSGWRD
jgi:hypothetical protein